MSSIIKKNSVRMADEASPHPAPGAAPRPGAHAKRVELLRVGGQVRALEVTCSCGEVTVVELETPPSPSQAP